jgi:prefoldin subunit 5
VFESDNSGADQVALVELEGLLRVLGDEMAGLRRRAQQAEARVREFEQAEATRSSAPGVPDPRVVALERENEELRRRLDGARSRTLQLIARMRFLRQQQAQGEER